MGEQGRVLSGETGWRRPPLGPRVWVTESGLHMALGTSKVIKPVLGEGSLQSPSLVLVGVGWIVGFSRFLSFWGFHKEWLCPGHSSLSERRASVVEE